MTHLSPNALSCDRRRFLQLGTATTAAAVAGCFGPGGSDYPSYTDWIPSSDDTLVAAYIDFRVSRESEEADRLLPLVLPSQEESEPEEFVPQIPSLDAIQDPLIRFPLQVGSQILAAASLGIAAGGFANLVNRNRPDQLANELLATDGVAVATADIDTGEADERLRSGTPAIPGRVEFERIGDNGDFTLYTPASNEGDGVTAVSETAVVAANTREKARRTLNAWRGDGTRAVDDSSPFASLVETAGVGDLAVGWEGSVQLRDYYIGDEADRPADGLVSQRDSAFASVSFAPEDGNLTAELAVRDDALDDSRREQFESTFGQSSEDITVTGKEDRVSLSGTYPNDVLDIEFADPEQTPEPETPRPSDDVPPEVREAVPEGTFSFSYDGEQQVQITVEREFEADELTVRAVESGWENSTTTTDVITYLTAYIDPEGDEVWVIVTVDGKSAVVASREFP